MFLAAMYFLSFATAIISIGAVFWLFNCLVRLEHDRHPGEWVRDGSPIGLGYLPADARLIRGSLARAAVAFKWIFRTPAWARQEEQAKWLLWKFRLAYAAFVYGVLMTLLTIGLALSLAT
jgi:hypothetical protein